MSVSRLCSEPIATITNPKIAAAAETTASSDHRARANCGGVVLVPCSPVPLCNQKSLLASVFTELRGLSNTGF